MLFAIKPIQQPYGGPFTVNKHTDKHFTIQTNILRYRERIVKKLYQLTDLNRHFEFCDAYNSKSTSNLPSSTTPILQLLHVKLRRLQLLGLDAMFG